MSYIKLFYRDGLLRSTFKVHIQKTEVSYCYSLQILSLRGMAPQILIPLQPAFGDRFRQGMVRDVDPERKVVVLEPSEGETSESEVPYDILVMATGSTAPFPAKYKPAHSQSKDVLQEAYDKYTQQVNEQDFNILDVSIGLICKTCCIHYF